MGRTSKGHPGLDLFKAVRLPPAKQAVISIGALPVAKRLITALSSEQGVQQGDPLGPFLFSLVLHKLVQSIAGAAECSGLTFNCWYLDDGILAVPKSAINHAIHLIQLEGPPLGLRINTAKC
ncbi:hypothetical protein EMCRGX_G024354 [Ephydatia muelleri]